MGVKEGLQRGDSGNQDRGSEPFLSVTLQGAPCIIRAGKQQLRGLLGDLWGLVQNGEPLVHQAGQNFLIPPDCLSQTIGMFLFAVNVLLLWAWGARGVSAWDPTGDSV